MAEQVTMKARLSIWNRMKTVSSGAKPEATVATERPTKDTRKRRLRPTRSARGTTAKAATAPRCTQPNISASRDCSSPKLSAICFAAAVSMAWS